MTARARARRIRMVLADVDGTLTDGTLAVLPDGEEIKAYHVRDGQGVLLGQLAGLMQGLITGKTSRGLETRAARLRLDELVQGAVDKMPPFREILARRGLRPEEVAYLGDDVGDLPVLKSVGLAAVVADAHPRVRRRAHYVCKACGGRGAYRELIDFILTAQDKWDLVESRFETLSDRRI